MESLVQLEAMCERLYLSQDSAERAHAENTLKCFSTNTEYISQCQFILDNSSTPYALMLASSSLLKQVTEHSLSLQLRLDIRNYIVNYLANRGPELQPVVTGSLIQLLCRLTKFGWFDDDIFRDVVKEATNFLVQFVIDNQVLHCLYQLLTKNHKKTIKKEACRMASNITAGNRNQIQAVIKANIIPPLLHHLQNAEFDVKNDAAWAISNVTSGGSHDQIRYYSEEFWLS